MLNFRLLRPAILVDINRIPGPRLCASRRRATPSAIGALTRHHQLETSPVIAQHFPVLAERDDARGASCDPQSRHHRRQPVACRSGRRTADDGAAARCRACTSSSANGRRTVAARDFFLDALIVDLADDELVTEIALPKLPPRHRLGLRGSRAPQRRFRARGRRRDADGGRMARSREARIAMTGVAPTRDACARGRGAARRASARQRRR